MSKNKTPHPYMYMRFDKPSKWDWVQGGQWHISRLEYLRLHENQWIPSPIRFEIGFNEPSPSWQKGTGWDMPRIGLLKPTGYNCPCVLEFRHKDAFEGEIDSISVRELRQLSAMRLSLILVKGGLSTWECFFERYPLALDYIEIRLAYQDYIVGLILSAPKRLWQWLRRKRK